MNLDLLRSFFEIAEHSSLSKAADRLRVSQSTLTRQMHALEHEIGGKLLERGPSGVALTASGHALLEGIRPVLAKFDSVMADVRKRARGQSASLRIGYLMSAAAEYLTPALAALRRAHPEVKVKLIDLSPGEQVASLRNGEIDVALMGYAGSSVEKEFYLKRLSSHPVLIALPESHALAKRSAIALADLRDDHFVGAVESDLPGHNRWVTQLCRKAGFRARFVDDAESLSEGMAMIVTEGAVSLIPDYAKRITAPGVVFKKLSEPVVKWDLLVAWQRGKVSEPLRVLLDALSVKPVSA